VSERFESTPHGQNSYGNGFWRALDEHGDSPRNAEDAQAQAILALASAINQLAVAVDRAATQLATGSPTPQEQARRRRWQSLWT
jgi:flagellar hook-basal body complex protein FliE